jgi:hypothetical protein
MPGGRKPKGYNTKQMRCEEELAELLSRLAGMNGKDLPDFLLEWLKPLAEAEYARRVEEMSRELRAKKASRKKEGGD